jgi:endonuclease/exonuclease/phosphatase family metal-dependent hydrolase
MLKHKLKMKYPFILTLAAALLLGNSLVASASNNEGSFNVLSYNVGGLPAFLSSSADPETYTPQIGTKLNAFDLVNVQEDFNYHKLLYANDTHPYRTPTSGGAGIGDGMNFMSIFPFEDTDRETWTDRYGVFDCGSDELTPKGFMYNQVKLADGIYVDVYNLHADADTDANSEAARRSNLSQLASYIEQYSQGHAVIVFGDTNCRYTRTEDNLKALFVDRLGMKDVWIEKIRNGSYPEMGADALLGPSGATSAGNEVVDKIFYRSGTAITLAPTSYKVENTYFTDSNGSQLSDHYAISANFTYTKNDKVTYSELWGGNGGIAFNFLRSTTPIDSRPASVTLRGGNRIDAIAMTYANGTTLSTGGNGGTEKTLVLANDEYVTKAVIYKDSYKSGERIFYVELTTNKNRTLSNGVKSGTSITLEAPSGSYIAGFFGRAEANVDKLGAIYKTLP